MQISDFITASIQAVVPDAEVHLTDLTGSEDHWHCVVISPSFDGQRTFQRQRPILDVFTPHFQTGKIHALDLKCVTPTEIEEKFGGLLPAPFNPHDDGTPGIHR